jgi:hypothetical protein
MGRRASDGTRRSSRRRLAGALGERNAWGRERNVCWGDRRDELGAILGGLHVGPTRRQQQLGNCPRAHARGGRRRAVGVWLGRAGRWLLGRMGEGRLGRVGEVAGPRANQPTQDEGGGGEERGGAWLGRWTSARWAKKGGHGQMGCGVFPF